MSENQVPSGFELIRECAESPFDQVIGEYYMKTTDAESIIGFRVRPHHLNIAGSLHGGALATLFDWQAAAVKPYLGITKHTPTISLSVDYLAPAHLGEWLEMHVKAQQRTGRMIFTRAEVFADGRLVGRSNAIYRIPGDRR